MTTLRKRVIVAVTNVRPVVLGRDGLSDCGGSGGGDSGPIQHVGHSKQLSDS